MLSRNNFVAVQRNSGTCEQALDTQDQPALGSLNTCLACPACGAASCASSPPRLNGLGGGFPRSLNRETASCHSGCRNMTGFAGSAAADARASGGVRPNRITHFPHRTLEGKRQSFARSEDCGFPFGSHFLRKGLRLCAPSNPQCNQTRPTWLVKTDRLLLGGFFGFSALSFPFTVLMLLTLT
jgi:hypothetical protein